MAIGASYFGNRILRHVAADMDALAADGFTGVLHTVSENDLAHYREQMRRIVEVSHDAGLEVQLGPWGLAGVFGGEAESAWVMRNPERVQELDDGTRVGAGCLSDPALRAFVRSWAEAAVEMGADRVFWDEPHWAYPPHFGRSSERWACRCVHCRNAFAERFGHAMPTAWTEEVQAFREAMLVDFVNEMVAEVDRLGATSTVCLLPLTSGPLGLADWDPVAAAPGLSTLATDPYWKAFDRPVVPFVSECSARVRELAATHDLTPQIWIQGFGLGPDDAHDIEAAVATARQEGITDLWTWGFEACGHLTGLGTRDPERVWSTLRGALTARPDA